MEGVLYTFGWGHSGQLGNGTNEDSSWPFKIKLASGVVSIVCGSRTTFAVLNNGNVLACGRGDDGQLGIGEKINSYEFEHVNFPYNSLYDYSFISCRGSHVLYLDKNGNTWAWGSNRETQISSETQSLFVSPVKISSLSNKNVCKIAAGRLFSAVLLSDGTVLTQGSNSEGQLGRRKLSSINYDSPWQSISMPCVIENISCGSRHTIAVDSFNKIYSWGCNKYGQLGLTSNITFSPEPHCVFSPDCVCEIFTGFRTSFIRCSNGSVVYAFGQNNYGQLGIKSDEENIFTPTKIPNLSDHTIIVNIAGGGNHTIAIFLERSFVLGSAPSIYSNVPLLKNEHFVLSVYTCGRNVDGELGLAKRSNIPEREFVQTNLKWVITDECNIDVISKFIKISAGWAHSAVAICSDKLLSSTDIESYDTAAVNFYARIRILFSRDGDLEAGFPLFLNYLLQLLVCFQLFSSDSANLVIFRMILTICVSNIIFILFTFTTKPLNRIKTSLPAGTSSMQLFAFVSIIYEPLIQSGKFREEEALVCLSLLTCLLGFFEFLLIPLASLLLKYLPDICVYAALGSTAISFLSIDFFSQIFQNSLTGFVPLIIILVSFASKLSFKIPAGFIALLSGVLIKYTVSLFQGETSQIYNHQSMTNTHTGIYDIYENFYPKYFEVLQTHGLSLIFPLAILNTICNLAVVGSAKKMDRYSVKTSLFINSIFNMLSPILWLNPFPICVFMGHSAYKLMGARSGYVLYNVIFFIICLFLYGYNVGEFYEYLSKIIPIESVVPILLWIGISITSDAFVLVVSSYRGKLRNELFAVVTFGLLPGIASFVHKKIKGIYNILGKSEDCWLNSSNLFLEGFAIISGGYLVVSIVWGCLLFYSFEKRFYRASFVSILSSIFVFLDFMHHLDFIDLKIICSIDNGVQIKRDLMIAYLLMGVCFWCIGKWFDWRRVKTE